MCEIKLVLPQEHHKAAILRYIEDHRTHGEEKMHGSSLLHTMESVEAWLEHLSRLRDPDITYDHWVTSTTFLGVRKSDEKIVGTIDIRHELNDYLRLYGGHIGYGVSPVERRKGYASAMLKEALVFCERIGMERVMIACNKDNVASARTIQKNGGILERENAEEDGNLIQVYWITMGGKESE